MKLPAARLATDGKLKESPGALTSLGSSLRRWRKPPETMASTTRAKPTTAPAAKTKF